MTSTHTSTHWKECANHFADAVDCILRAALQSRLLSYETLPDACGYPPCKETYMRMRAMVRDVIGEHARALQQARAERGLGAWEIALEATMHALSDVSSACEDASDHMAGPCDWYHLVVTLHAFCHEAAQAYSYYPMERALDELARVEGLEYLRAVAEDHPPLPATAQKFEN